jgi:hypothetical protein
MYDNTLPEEGGQPFAFRLRCESLLGVGEGRLRNVEDAEFGPGPTSGHGAVGAWGDGWRGRVTAFFLTGSGGSRRIRRINAAFLFLE